MPVIDDSDAPIVGAHGVVASSGTFATTGSWTTSTTQGAFGGSHTSSSALGSGTSTGTWTMAVTPGSYEVDVTWPAAGSLSANVTYNVYDGSTLLGSVSVNQQTAPSGVTDNGLTWQSLGNFTVTGTQLKVTVSNTATDGQVCADAVRLLPAYQPTPKSSTTVIPALGSNSWLEHHQHGPLRRLRW